MATAIPFGEQILLLFVYLVFSSFWIIIGWFGRRRYEKMKREKEELQAMLEELEQE